MEVSQSNSLQSAVALLVVLALRVKVGCLFGGYSRPLSNIFIFAGEQSNMFTLLWHTSAHAEAGLFSSYKALNVGGVIQYESDE